MMLEPVELKRLRKEKRKEMSVKIVL